MMPFKLCDEKASFSFRRRIRVSMEHRDRHKQDREFLEQVLLSTHHFIRLRFGGVVPVIGSDPSVIKCF